MNTEAAARKWGLKERTVKNAVKDSRIRFSRDLNGAIVIPDDELAPIPKRVIQSLIQSVYEYKNNNLIDLSGLQPSQRESIFSAMRQLEWRGYLAGIGECSSLPVLFESVVVTNKGRDLAMAKPLPGSFAKTIREKSLLIAITLIEKYLVK